MTQTIEQALATAHFYTDDQDYVFIQLPARAITAAAGVVAEVGEPFCAILVDKDEVTLMIPADALNDFGKRLPGHITTDTRYRLITVDVALEPTLVGFMAHISRALADVGIPIFPYAAYTRDHIFVPANQVDEAIGTLQKLKSNT